MATPSGAGRPADRRGSRRSSARSRRTDELSFGALEDVARTVEVVPGQCEDGGPWDVINKFVPPVTRLPVLDQKGVARFIIHQSFVYRFVTKQAIAQPGYTVAGATLKDFLDFENMRQVVSATMAFVGESGTLADAKSRLEAVANCQDVFVTKSGDAAEEVLGWLTNTEITRRSRAG